MLLSCGVEDSWESLECKEIKPINPEGNQSWIFIRRTDVEAKAPILWLPDVKSWFTRCWERLKAGGEGDDRGWDGWMASLTQWTWVEASSGRWWRTGKCGVLQSMGSQRVRHNWATEQQQSMNEGMFPFWSSLRCSCFIILVLCCVLILHIP